MKRASSSRWRYWALSVNPNHRRRLTEAEWCDKPWPAAVDADGAEGNILITCTPNPIKGGGLYGHHWPGGKRLALPCEEHARFDPVLSFFSLTRARVRLKKSKDPRRCAAVVADGP